MNNKILIKIGIVVFIIVLIYILFITFIVSPKITKYLTNSETQKAKAQLNRISSILKSKENALKKNKQEKIEEHKKDIKDISTIAYNLMNSNYKLYLKGKLTKKEAIENSLDVISKITFGYKDDYIYVLDRKGNLLYHPDKRYANKNIYNTPDAKGRLFVIGLIKNTVQNGSSYTKYSWSKLNSIFISEKITFSIYFEPLELIISAGVYIQSIEEEVQKEKEKMISILYPLINSITIGSKGYIFIMDDNNKIVLHPNRNLLNVNVSEFKQPNSKSYMVDDLKEAYKSKRKWEYKWSTVGDKENYKYNKISWVDFNDFFSWYIVSSIYEEDLKTKANEINKITLNVSIILLLVLLTIAMYIIRKLLSPISIMTKNAKLIKSGKFDIRNNIVVKDELGFLANQFDEMLDSIDNNTKELEKKVEERTAKIEYKLYHDELTGLKNRNLLIKKIKEEEFYALSLIDIDEFNSVNELYGFDVGNEVLVKVAKILKEFSSEKNIELYKLDSDIFAILDTNIMNFITYHNFLEELQNLFKNKEIYIDSLKIDIYVYITIGTSISQKESIKTANIALKRAKEKSYKYMVYNQEIDTKENVQKTMYWREKIKDAIENDKLIPFYQPIYNQNEELVKYETLMRICEKKDSEIKYISPGLFLDIAIKTKQYFKLNELVIEKTLKNLEKIDKSISINISFADIQNLEFVETLGKNVKKLTKEQRSRLVFEILESDFISDYKVLNEFILEYRKKGIRIAIDDFGTGYSNFSHILKIKPDYIKIDGSLIKNLDTDKHSYEIVKSIIDFSHSLGIKVIAEFIHNEEIYKIVKELKVDEFQGFYLGEPKLLIEQL